jgi:hypothetical protein
MESIKRHTYVEAHASIAACTRSQVCTWSTMSALPAFVCSCKFVLKHHAKDCTIKKITEKTRQRQNYKHQAKISKKPKNYNFGERRICVRTPHSKKLSSNAFVFGHIVLS